LKTLALLLLLQITTGAPLYHTDRVGKWTGKVEIEKPLNLLKCQYVFYKPDGKTPDVTYWRSFPKGTKTCPKTIGFGR
jgi:hypothetical protein